MRIVHSDSGATLNIQYGGYSEDWVFFMDHSRVVKDISASYPGMFTYTPTHFIIFEYVGGADLFLELGWTEMWEHLQLSWLCCDCDILIPFGLERKTSFKRPVWEINENVTTGRQTSQLRQLWTRWPGQRSRGAYKLYKHFLTRHPPTCKTISRAFSDVLCSIQRICAVVVLAYSAVLWTEGPLPFWMHSTLLDRNAKINDKFWLKLVYKVQKLIGSLRQRW